MKCWCSQRHAGTHDEWKAKARARQKLLYYSPGGKERNLLRCRSYYQRNRDAVEHRRREWYSRNREKVKQQPSRYANLPEIKRREIALRQYNAVKASPTRWKRRMEVGARALRASRERLSDWYVAGKLARNGTTEHIPRALIEYKRAHLLLGRELTRRKS